MCGPWGVAHRRNGLNTCYLGWPLLLAFGPFGRPLCHADFVTQREMGRTPRHPRSVLDSGAVLLTPN